MTVRQTLSLLLVVVVIACAEPSPREVADGSDPIAALSVPVRSARYDGAFWMREAEDGSDLWREAVDVCRVPVTDDRPNCQTVAVVLTTLALEEAADEARAQLETLLRDSEDLFAAIDRATARPEVE